MAEENLSLVFKMTSDVAGTMKSISGQSKQVSKEFEELQKQTRQLGDRYAKLNKDAAKTSTQASAMKKEMNEAARAFKKTGDAADRVKLEKLTAKYNDLTDATKGYRKAAQETSREMSRLADKARKLGSSGGGKGGKMGVGQALAAMGMGQMAGQLLGQGTSVLAGSMFGGTRGGIVSGALSSAVSGAAMGSMFGPTGALIGGLAGAAGGALGGGLQAFGQKDDAFKGWVRENVGSVLQEEQDRLKTGSAIAGGRETDLIAFSTMLKDQGAAEGLMADMVDMANKTPFLFDDLKTMAKVLTTYQYGIHEMIPTLTDIGDAGSALGMDAQGMGMVATGLGRMRSSGKTTLEYLNLLGDRGVKVIEYLGDALGLTTGGVYDAISKGKINGVDAARIIQEGMHRDYSGSMEIQSGTFPGLSSTVEGLNQEQAAAMGKGYNEARKEGLQAQIDWLSGANGERMRKAYEAQGAWEASLENQKDQMIRDAQAEAMNSEAYLAAEAQGDNKTMTVMLKRAELQGLAEFNASEGAQLKIESEKALVNAVRNDASLKDEYWNAGKIMGEEFDKGIVAARYDQTDWNAIFGPAGGEKTGGNTFGTRPWEQSFAYGIQSVPYDGFPAILHQGEQVLTAAQARSRKSSSVNINIQNMAVRQESDIDAIASALALQIRQAAEVYGG